MGLNLYKNNALAYFRSDTIYFLENQGLELIIEGTLLAQGNQSHTITFASKAQEPIPGDWTWIYFSPGSQGTLEYCTISHANTGIRIKSTSPGIGHSLITDNIYGLNISHSNAAIINNTITQNCVGINADSCQASITHNAIFLNTCEAVILGHASSDTSFVNNLIYDNGGHGLVLEYSSLAPIVNNTIFRNQQNGIYLRKGSITKIYNNLITHNIGYGIACWLASWPTILYNDLWGNTGRNYYDYASGDGFTPLPAAGELAEDPLYIDQNIPDLHLQTASIAIDAGDPKSPYNQEPLPNGGRINMGAYGNTSQAALSCEPQCTLSIPQTIGVTGAAITIPVRLDSQQGITGIENLLIRFVSSTLIPKNINPTGIGAGLTIVSNLTVPGEIRISAFTSGTPIHGNGEILLIACDIKGTPGSATPLDIISVKRILGEDDQPVCSALNDGSFTVLSEVSIQGSISYYTNTSPVPDVRLTLEGPTTYSTNSAADGAYILSNVPDGRNYTLTPSKLGDIGSGIGIYDAVLIARNTVGLETFTILQSQAADVNYNDNIDIGDAIDIAKYTVGLKTLPFATGSIWAFIPDHINYTPLLGSKQNQNFTSLIYGDVDGNWKRIRAKALDAPITDPLCILSIPGNLSADTGDSIDIPIYLDAQTPILGLGDLVITYDDQILDVQAISTTPFSRSLTLVANLEIPGIIRISGFGTSALSGQGILANITFSVTGTSGDASALDLVRVADIIAEKGETLSATLTDGRFVIPSKLSLPQLTAKQGDTISCLLSVTRINNLYGIENLVIYYDPVLLKALSITTTSLTSGFTLIPNLTNPGEIRITLFGTTPVSCEGGIIEMLFSVIGHEGESPLDLVSVNSIIGEGNEEIPVHLSDGAVTIKSDQCTFTLPIHRGWNVVGLGVDIPVQTSGMCQMINEQNHATICDEVSTYIAGGWSGHKCGLPFNDFILLPGRGYLMKALSSGEWEQKGAAISSPLEIPLVHGWNLICLPHWAEGQFDAQGLIDMINTQAGERCCLEIHQFYAGSWRGHIDGLPFNNFTIVPGEGYLVKMNKGMRILLEREK